MADTIDFIPPDRPPMLHITAETPPHIYLLGNKTFTGGNFHIINILHRTLTHVDDFILGLLSVLLIAILSETVQVVLLRTNNRRVAISKVINAFLISEASHFRNIFIHLRKLRFTRSTLPANGICISMFIIFVAIMLFTTDVIIVVLTQPTLTLSQKHQYTIRPVQPVATDSNLSSSIYQSLLQRPCITPVMHETTQRRKFIFVACVLFEQQPTHESTDSTGDNSIAENITIASWFHIAGSDHNISFGNNQWIYFKTSAQIIMDVSGGGSRRLIFHINDTEEFAQARYLHALTIHSAKSWVCHRENAPAWCETADRFTKATTWHRNKTNIKLWAGRGNNTHTSIVGVQSVFQNIDLPMAIQAVRFGMHPLVVCGAVIESTSVNHSVFTRVANDSDFRDSVDGLIEEEGRPVGVLFLALLVFVFAVVLALLRFWLRPISLAALTVREIQAVDRYQISVSDRPIAWSGSSFRPFSSNSVAPSWRDEVDFESRDNNLSRGVEGQSTFESG